MKLKEIIQLTRNMGSRYMLFRTMYEVKRKSGMLKRKFPTGVPFKSFLNLSQWRSKNIAFFFNSRNEINISKDPSETLKKNVSDMLNGNIQFFNSLKYNLANSYDWITNPENGFKYDITKHWTEIPDYSEKSGDIKYVWEKSRFTYLYKIIRGDYHFDEDHSQFVLNEINDWINKNPINCGPNYRCSQETSLRILNWTFALHFYKHSDHLSDELFQKVINSIYWQLQHVYENINFSRIAVRNNHAITETLMLYLSGFLFPFIPETKRWASKGKKWFEEEIAYQVYEDGTYLQFSMNYHRVVVQLMTWAIRLTTLNGEKLSQVVFDRAHASLNFLTTITNTQTGHLPNYGANDGSLFFPLNDNEFRDFRPQLQALAATLGKALFDEAFEDSGWYGLPKPSERMKPITNGVYAFIKGGYYVHKDEQTMTFIRCGNHKDRPSQADNLHLDITVNNTNIICDAGTYKYNTSAENIKYFFGTASHNTVMLGENDQMKKGGRFIWFNWSQAKSAGWKETDEYIEFSGEISAFGHIAKSITHRRTVRKHRGRNSWEVTDQVNHNTGLRLHQLWHLKPIEDMDVMINTQAEGQAEKKESVAWESSSYGIKDPIKEVSFTTHSKIIRTSITVATDTPNEHTAYTSVLSGKE